MSDCTDVCEAVMDTLIQLGYEIKTGEGDEDHQDVLDAFCEYNKSHAALLDACKLALKEWYPRIDGCAKPDCLVCARSKEQKAQVETTIAKAKPKTGQ